MRKALVVGVDDYEQCPLYGCCNDADDIANILSRNEDGPLIFQFVWRKML